MLRASLPRLAASVSKKPLPLGASPQDSPDLLAPKILYRRLLRVHRKVLPVEMRLMGDEYVKAEFRRTRTATNPLHLVGFLSEWQKYLDFHEKQAVLLKGKKRFDAGEEVGAAVDQLAAEEWKEGMKLPDEVLESVRLLPFPIPFPSPCLPLLKKLRLTTPQVAKQLSADQMGQLYELLQATKEVWKTEGELPDGAHVISRENVGEAEDVGIKGLGNEKEGRKK